MKKLICISLMTFIIRALAFPCTSFVVKSNKVICGFNFDYYLTEFSFIINKKNIGNIFSHQRKTDEGIILYGIRINDKGLMFIPQFKNNPDDNFKKKLDKNEIYIGKVSPLINDYQEVDQIKKFLKDKKLIAVTPPTEQSLHFLCADKYGKNIIIEIENTKNAIVENNKKFTVMTNFQNSVFKDKPLKDIYPLAGGDRYVKAYQYIQENIKNFDIDKAWEVLKKTKQLGSYFTQYSAIILPEKNIIYLVLNQEFDRIWKISIDNATIETYNGFENKKIFDINEKPVSSSELLNCK